MNRSISTHQPKKKQNNKNSKYQKPELLHLHCPPPSPLRLPQVYRQKEERGTGGEAAADQAYEGQLSRAFSGVHVYQCRHEAEGCEEGVWGGCKVGSDG